MNGSACAGFDLGALALLISRTIPRFDPIAHKILGPFVDADHPAAVRDAYSFFRPAAPYRIVGKHP